ncbi:phosphate signaling complex protein PhoU [Kaarinaea lacus]
MTRRMLNRKESKIHDLLVEMSSATTKAIEETLDCFQSCDRSLAEKIIGNDKLINKLQHQVEDECVGAIALYQPVASDLRDLISDTFIAIELERIADHAADIARIVLKMHKPPSSEFVESITSLGQQTLGMLVRAMAAYDKIDNEQALGIAKEDDEIDSAEQAIVNEILDHMRKGSEDTTSCTQVL